MDKTYTGGCACGAIRYEIPGEPLVESDCQCRDCQRKSGTGHGSYLTFAGRRSVKLTGEAKHWDIVADSGNVKTRAFCPTCGSPVYLTFAAMPVFSPCTPRAWTIQADTSCKSCFTACAVTPGTTSIQPCRNSTRCRLRRDSFCFSHRPSLRSGAAHMLGRWRDSTESYRALEHSPAEMNRM